MGSFFQDVLEGKVRNVRKWIEEGENVTQYDGYGNTALHLATEKGYRGVCKVWLYLFGFLTYLNPTYHQFQGADRWWCQC